MVLFVDFLVIKKDLNTWDLSFLFVYDLNSKENDVEPVQDLFKRCEEFLNSLKEKNYQSVLIVSHSAIYRTLRCLLKNNELKGKLYDGTIENCQYEEFEL